MNIIIHKTLLLLSLYCEVVNIYSQDVLLIDKETANIKQEKSENYSI